MLVYLHGTRILTAHILQNFSTRLLKHIETSKTYDHLQSQHLQSDPYTQHFSMQHCLQLSEL